MVSNDDGVAAPQHETFLVRSSMDREERTYPFTPLKIGSRRFKVPRTFQYSNSPGENFFRSSGDLLHEVFSYFKKDIYTARERSQLLNFMLICKGSFHYPARVLWSRIGSDFLAVLRLLDLEMWDDGYYRKLYGPPLFYAIRENMERLTEHIMWQKFLYYADAIEWIDTTTVNVCPGTITFLAHLLPPTDPIVFPCLQYLTWTESFTDSNDLLYMLTPALSELRLRIFDFFDGEHTSVAFMDWITRMIHAASHLCQHLRFLSVDGMGSLILNPSVLNYFCTLHQLAIIQASPGSGEAVVAPPTVLRALQQLEIVSYHGSNSLLRSLPHVVPFMTNSLRVVNLQSVAGTSALETDSFVGSFHPLLHLRHLTEVKISFMMIDFRFTDDDLITLARAWPDIVEIAFAFSRLGFSPVPQLQTIGRVAAHCLSLEKITLPFLAGPGKDTTFTISAPSSHPLKEIRTHTMTWDVHQSNAITAGLHKAFPNLQGVFSDGGDPQHELLWAILPPYILSSQIAAYPISRILRGVYVW